MDIREIIWILSSMFAIFDLVFGEPYSRNRPRKIQPRFLPTPTNITMHRGEMAVLKCHIRDVGTKTVVWRRKGSDIPLTIGEDTFTQDEPNISIEVDTISEEKSQWDLIIKDVQPHHAGMYLCQVTASKLYTHYVTLHVLNESVSPVSALQLTGNTYIDQGDQIRLTCNATGAKHPPLDVEWYFKGERIVTSKPHWRDRTQLLKRKIGRSFISTLIIDRSTMNYSGNYVCRSSDLIMDSIFVNVLSVVKPNVSRRDYENLSQADDLDSSSSSSAAPSSRHFHQSPKLFIMSLIFLVFSNFTVSFNLNEHLTTLLYLYVSSHTFWGRPS